MGDVMRKFSLMYIKTITLNLLVLSSTNALATSDHSANKKCHLSEKNAEISNLTKQNLILASRVASLNVQLQAVSGQLNSLSSANTSLKNENSILRLSVATGGEEAKNPILEIKGLVKGGPSPVSFNTRIYGNTLDSSHFRIPDVAGSINQVELHAFLNKADTLQEIDDLTIQQGVKDPAFRWLNASPEIATSSKKTDRINFWQEWCPARRSSSETKQELMNIVNSEKSRADQIAAGSHPCGVVLVNKDTFTVYDENNPKGQVRIFNLFQTPDPEDISKNIYTLRGYKSGVLKFTRTFVINNGSYITRAAIAP